MIAIIQANIKEFDPRPVHIVQDTKADYFYFTEKNLPYPLFSLNDRMKAKYIKLQAHKFLSNYSHFLWLDGSMNMTRADFVSDMIKEIGENDVLICDHPDRKTTKEEFDFIIWEILKNDPYCSSRYNLDALRKEKESFGEEFPLYACGFFLVANNSWINKLFNSWWDHCLRFSEFDQCYFSVIAKTLKVKTLNFNHVMGHYIKREKHLK